MAAVSAMLITGGSGLGLLSMSPWQRAGAGVGATLAGQSTREGMRMSPLDYYADALLRPDDPSRGMNGSDAHNETRMILARSIEHGRVTEQDRPYLVKLIAQRASVDQAVAQQRLTRISDQARQAEQQARITADAARKVAAAFSLWAFASLLIGAFVASLAATIGGRARDR